MSTSTSQSASAVRYHRYGPPAEVLQLDTLAVAAPGAGQVTLRLRAAALHPSDLGMILGNYGRLAGLPAVAGREAVGEVVAVGPGVTEVAPGDRVRWPIGVGAWQAAATVPAVGLRPVPPTLSDDIAALAGVNPGTAYRLLHDFGALTPGGWVVQNAGNSAVGLHVAQIGAHLGLKVLSVVRRPDALRPFLLENGATAVLADDDTLPEAAKAAMGGDKAALALNSIGGESALRLLRLLAPGGTHVTFGAMAFEPIRWPTRQLIFDDHCLRGFWFDRWQRTRPPAEVAALHSAVEALFLQGVLRVAVADRLPLAEFRAALALAAQPRVGKVLLVP